jgi:hypothetical protein
MPQYAGAEIVMVAIRQCFTYQNAMEDVEGLLIGSENQTHALSNNFKDASLVVSYNGLRSEFFPASI